MTLIDPPGWPPPGCGPKPPLIPPPQVQLPPPMQPRRQATAAVCASSFVCAAMTMLITVASSPSVGEQVESCRLRRAVSTSVAAAVAPSTHASRRASDDISGEEWAGLPGAPLREGVPAVRARSVQDW